MGTAARLNKLQREASQAPDQVSSSPAQNEPAVPRKSHFTNLEGMNKARHVNTLLQMLASASMGMRADPLSLVSERYLPSRQKKR